MFSDRIAFTAAVEGGLRRLVVLAALAGVLALGPGCESTPDRTSAEGEAEPDAEAAEGQAAAEAMDDEDDPLAAEFEAFAERVEDAADARAEPANPADPDIDWLAPTGDLSGGRSGEGVDLGRRGTADDAIGGDVTDGEAMANVGPELDVTDLADGLDVEQPSDIGEPAADAAARDADAGDAAAADELDVDELVTVLGERLAAERGEGLRPWLGRAALTLADPTRELTDNDLGTLPSDDRRLVLAYQRMFTHLGRSLGGDEQADRHELELAAEELLEQLQAERYLTIRKAELCTRVSGYGIYEPFESRTFTAGRERSTIVYVELDDFATERDSEGRHVVRLRQEIVLYNASDGLAVWRVEPSEIVDRSRNQRRDFFLVQMAKLPPTLSVGKYLLKVTITDEIGEAVDEATIPIEFVAGG